MSIKITFIAVSVGALLTGCATQKESPIYQQSTKYKVHSPYQTPAEPVTDYASYPAPAQQTPTRAPQITTPYPGVQPLPANSRVIATDATAIQPTSPAPAQSSTIQAPTDQAYGDTFGTPGYHAMQANGETVSSTATAAASTVPPIGQTVTIPEPPRITAPAPTPTYPQAEAQAYIPPSATIRAPEPKAPISAPLEGNTAHKVVEGDTVYSLSRRLCVSVDDIKSLNGLDGSFSIRLDDYIRLPASRC